MYDVRGQVFMMVRLCLQVVRSLENPGIPILW